MNKRVGFESKRKLLHVVLCFYPFVFIYLDISAWIAICFSVAYIFVMLISELVRLKTVLPTPTGYMVRHFSRDMGRGAPHGSWKRFRPPYPVIGLLVSLVLFGYYGWLPAAIVLCVGDPVSGITKSVGGSIPLGYGIGALASMAVVWLATASIWIALLSSLIGMVGDLLPRRLNDNLTIPILAGVGWFVAAIA